jgi:hypothetical protein
MTGQELSLETRIRATLLLCDAGQVVGGKLYILGGGWSYIWLPSEQQPVSFAAAIDLSLPWDHTNRPVVLLAHLLSEDGHEVTPENGDSPVRAEGTVVAGRPPSARPGTDIHIPIVIPFPPMVLPPGGYVCELQADGVPIQSASFQIALAQGQQPGGPA